MGTIYLPVTGRSRGKKRLLILGVKIVSAEIVVGKKEGGDGFFVLDDTGGRPKQGLVVRDEAKTEGFVGVELRGQAKDQATGKKDMISGFGSTDTGPKCGEV